MTYEQAVEVSPAEPWKVIFRGEHYFPFGKPVQKMIPAPKDKRRLGQFWELYLHYREDWDRAAAHFQLEEFESVVVFRTDAGPRAITFEEFTRRNRIHINMVEVDDEELD